MQSKLFYSANERQSNLRDRTKVQGCCIDAWAQMQRQRLYKVLSQGNRNTEAAVGCPYTITPGCYRGPWVRPWTKKGCFVHFSKTSFYCPPDGLLPGVLNSGTIALAPARYGSWDMICWHPVKPNHLYKSTHSILHKWRLNYHVSNPSNSSQTIY